jgi:hypothetical protein
MDNVIASNPSWHRLSRWRGECQDRFGGILQLPFISPGDEMKRLLRKTVRVLDVGAGVEMPLQRRVEESGAVYFSLDNDTGGTFDFRSFEEVPDDTTFDVVVANQILEHLSISSAMGMMCAIRDHLAPGGSVVATVPNAAHPARQWGDAAHVTAWPAGDIYGLMRESGLNVRSLGRYSRRPLTRNPIKRIIANAVCDVFRVDWCDSLLITAEKPA